MSHGAQLARHGPDDARAMARVGFRAGRMPSQRISAPSDDAREGRHTTTASSTRPVWNCRRGWRLDAHLENIAHGRVATVRATEDLMHLRSWRRCCQRVKNVASESWVTH